MKITISDSDYFEILVEIGYPIVKEEDLEFTRADIENYFIFPAMRDFFSWFPKIELQTTYVASRFTFPFPDDKTYGIIDARINTTFTGNGRTSSPFVNSLMFKQSSSGSRMYGTDNDYGVQEARFMERSYGKALTNYVKVHRIDIDPVLKTLTGYTNINGELNIQWAKYSTDFNDIPFKRKNEVINLAKSRILRGFAMLRSQINSDTGVDFNTSDFISRADTLEQKVMDKWQGMSKVAIIRN